MAPDWGGSLAVAKGGEAGQSGPTLWKLTCTLQPAIISHAQAKARACPGLLAVQNRGVAKLFMHGDPRWLDAYQADCPGLASRNEPKHGETKQK